MRAAFWLFVLVVAALLAVFAASNRESVSLAFWPLPFLVELPLYLVVLATLALGFVIGEAAAWFAAWRWRSEVRRRGRRIAALERELTATQAQLAPPTVPERTAPPTVRSQR
jgi:lipopolysaccharide assembly protein A